MERGAGPGDPNAGRLLLAVDTSTEQAGVALFDGARVAELSWHAGREQTVTLLAQVHALLTLHGHEIAAIEAIAVATGPGTFTGLRVGLSAAKGLLLGLGPTVALLGIPTLDAAAIPFAHAHRPIVPVVAAGRDRLVWATFEPDQGIPHQTTAPRNGTVDDLAATLSTQPTGTIVTGEFTLHQETIIAAIPAVTLPPRALRSRRPAALAALAWRRWHTGDTDDPATLAPVYLSR